MRKAVIKQLLVGCHTARENSPQLCRTWTRMSTAYEISCLYCLGLLALRPWISVALPSVLLLASSCSCFCFWVTAAPASLHLSFLHYFPFFPFPIPISATLLMYPRASHVPCFWEVLINAGWLQDRDDPGTILAHARSRCLLKANRNLRRCSCHLQDIFKDNEQAEVF